TLWLSLIGFTTLFAFLCYLTWSSTFGSRHFNQSVDLIIVLGAGIFTEEVTPMLKERLDRALEIYHHSENIPKLLVSG
ncbi:YdcF family protein, partial [Staphylococcus saprophyticus]